MNTIDNGGIKIYGYRCKTYCYKRVLDTYLVSYDIRTGAASELICILSLKVIFDTTIWL